MKRIILSLVAIVALSTATFAQWQGGNGQRQRFNREEMVKNRTEMMVKKYGLNEEQAAALQALNEKSMAQLGGPRDGKRPEKADSTKQRPRRERQNREGMGERPQRGPRFGGQLNAEYDVELQKIMTADQYKAYKEDMDKMMERMRNQGPRRRMNNE